MRCPKCQSDNTGEAKFCIEYGCELRAVKPPPAIDYAQPLSCTPKHLAEKILAARHSIKGERGEL